MELSLRLDMEQRSGHDFSRVRVHTGTEAEQSARDANAHAYTVGYNIVFGAKQYAPQTNAGRHLIAHELTHVLQQGAVEDSSMATIQKNDALRGSTTDSAIDAIRPQYIQKQRVGGQSYVGRPVFFCSKPILLSGLHGKSHAFFRVGGIGPGNPTFELEHEKSCPCAYQGWPRRNERDDVNATSASCIASPIITEACLET